MVKKIKVSSHKRHLKNGKIINVSQHNRNISDAKRIKDPISDDWVKNFSKKDNYFKILKDEFRILEHIKAFQNDFLEHDREALKDYEGDFILAIRPSGSNLLKLWNDEEINGNLEGEDYEKRREELERRVGWKDVYDVWIKQNNDRFFFGTKGKIIEVETKEMLDSIWIKYNTGKLYA